MPRSYEIRVDFYCENSRRGDSVSSLARRCIGLYRRASREKPGEEVVFEICWIRGLLPSIAKRSVTRIAEVCAKRKH